MSVPGDWFFASPWPGWVFLTAATAFLGLVAWAYKTEPDIARPAIRWIAGALRFLFLLGLVGLLHEPVRAVASSQTRPWEILVLLDASESMTLPDRIDAAVTRWTAMQDLLVRDGFLETLERSGCRLRVFPFAGTLGTALTPAPDDETEREGGPSPAAAPGWEGTLEGLRPDGKASALPDAVQEALRTSGGNPDALIALSDGRSNAGSEVDAAVRAARHRQVPVHTIAFGDPRGFPDLRIDRIAVNPVALLNDRIAVEIDVGLRGIPSASTRVVLSADDGQQDAEPLQAREGVQTVTLALDARTPGTMTLRARVEEIPGETLRENNEMTAQVRVLDRRLRVLLADGTPRWEFQYMRNALRRDPSVSLGVWLLSAAPGAVREGDAQVLGFPATLREMLEFDCLILGDLPPDALSPPDLENLHRYVTEFGGGLVVLAGERHGTPARYRGTTMEALLPVMLPERPEPWTRLDDGTRPYRLVRTPEAKVLAPFRLGAAAQEHDLVWDSLPGCFAHAPETTLKPLATPLVLARDGGSQEPVVSVQRVGIGRVLFSAVDETWRWRAGVGDVYLYRYWGGLLRMLGVGRLHAGDRRADLDLGGRDDFRVGEEVAVRAMILEEDFRPSRETAAQIRIEREGNESSTLELAADDALPGSFTGTWTPQEEGEYRLSLHVPGEPEVVREARVRLREREFQQPEADPDALRALSQQTDGISADAAGAGRILEAFSKPPPAQEKQEPPRPLWNRFPWFLALVAALAGEWGCRKAANRP